MDHLELVVITGMSGAGKSEAIRSFEDLGFFCVDNLPPALVPKFLELCAQSGGKVERVAAVIDIRGGDFFKAFDEFTDELETGGFQYSILFLEASDEALVRRFKETRRRHPLSQYGDVLEGIRAERKMLEELRGKATKHIDTTHLNARELKETLSELYGQGKASERLRITVITFGYKHGLPVDSDLVIDVRFLPNPYYVESLRNCTGDDPEVCEYVLKWPITKRFLRRLNAFLSFIVPQVIKEGRLHFVVSIGCTGGQHRSVVVGNEVAKHLERRGYQVAIQHRDVAARQDGVRRSVGGGTG